MPQESVTLPLVASTLPLPFVGAYGLDSFWTIALAISGLVVSLPEWKVKVTKATLASKASLSTSTLTSDPAAAPVHVPLSVSLSTANVLSTVPKELTRLTLMSPASESLTFPSEKSTWMRGNRHEKLRYSWAVGLEPVD